MKAQFDGIDITAVIGVVPSNVSHFDDEIGQYAHDPANSAKLKDMMGYGEHRLALPGTTTSDLASRGFGEIVARGLVSAGEVDGLYFVSQTPDYVLPATSSVLHGRFGLAAHAYCADLNDGCNGFVRGLFEACAFLHATQSGCAVLIAGDVLSHRVSRRDRNSFPLIGDAATVTVLRLRPGGGRIDIEIRNDGSKHEALIIPAGGARLPGSEATALATADEEGNWRSAEQLCMNGRDVFAFTQTVVPRFLAEFTDRQRANFCDYERIFAHQANAFIIDRLRKKLGVDETCMPDRVVRRWGNSSSATVPMLLASEAPTTHPLRCLLAGFGVGLSWGAADLALQPGVSQGILEV